jgi:ankyrin repeat protein
MQSQNIPLFFEYYQNNFEHSSENHDIVFDIHTAIKNDELENIKKYFNLENIDQQDSLGKTPLMHALKMNKRKIAKYLLKKGADINIQSNEGKLSFHYYTEHDDHDDNNIPIVTVGLMKKLVSNQNINLFMTNKTFNKNIISISLINKYMYDFIYYLFDFDIDFKNVTVGLNLCQYLCDTYASTVYADLLIRKAFSNKYINFIVITYGEMIMQLQEQYRMLNKYVVKIRPYLDIWNNIAKNPPLKITRELFTSEYCVICNDDEPTAVFLPCHHKVICTDCHEYIKDDKICCYCRTEIKHTIHQ